MLKQGTDFHTSTPVQHIAARYLATDAYPRNIEESLPYYRERHTIKPGITGWAQLCYPYGSSEQDATEKLQYDLFYVKNHSLLFYLAILVQTVEVIVWRKGAR
jgi:lipopolysaccharide/colanic/teichoic acid biosynthesis glycosyltransferase